MALVPSATGEQAASRERSFQAGMLDAGPSHSCAVPQDGRAACWGYEDVGQLGDGETTTTGSNVPSPVSLAAGRKAVAISVGLNHSCAVLDDGSAACWGSDDAGQLGDGATTAGSNVPSPVSLPAGRRAVAIGAGGSHTCAILDDGSAACWGHDGNGRLGDGATTTGSDVPSPVSLPAGKKAVAISGGNSHTCAILDDGSAACWGYDGVGQLGDGATSTGSDVPSPVGLPAGKKAVAISAGFSHTCAALDDGSAACWGSDDFGELGDGAPATGSHVPSPVSLAAGKKAVAITAGNGHTCAILDDASATCWGNDGSGELGDGTTTIFGSNVPVPVSLPAGRKALAISAGNIHTCAILDDGSAPCWGFDGNGELGDGGANATTVAPSTSAFSAGSMVTLVADISLRLEGAPTGIDRGASAQVTVRIENQGPDPATGVRVALSPLLVQIASANAGHGSVTGSTWDVGTLAVGAQGALLLTLSAPSAGAGSLRAELIGSEVIDPDSTPNNGASTEDDQAETSITVSAPASSAPASPVPPSPAALSISKFSLSSKTFRAKGLKGSRKVGTLIRFTLSAAAKVTVTIERKVAGRFRKAGSFSFDAKAGNVRRSFTGVLGNKPLATGRYRLRIRATSGARSATLGPVAFTIATGS
jgi:alpha-tubulin suppressor-like RCC1 family protein